MLTFSKFTMNDVMSLFNELSRSSRYVCFLRSPDFTELLYLSASFENVWGLSRETLIQEPSAFVSTFHPSIDIHEMHTKAFSRFFVNSPCQSLIFAIKTPTGETRHVEDHVSPVFNEENEVVAYAGIVKWLNEDELSSKKSLLSSFEAEQAKFLDDINHHREMFNLTDSYEDVIKLKNQLGNIVPPAAKRRNYYINGVSLSQREMQVSHLLVYGCTAKEIAKQLSLSPRTVEGYLINIKNKFCVPSKKELITHLTPQPEIRYFQGSRFVS